MNLEPLDPVSKELLDAARKGHGPRPGRRERVRGRIVASIGAAAFMQSAFAAATAATTWLKLGGFLAVLAVGVGGTYAALHASPSEPAPSLIAESDPVRTQATAAPPQVATEPHVTPDPAIAPSPPAAVAPDPEPPPPRVDVKRASVAPAKSQRETPSIGAETTLLLDAQAALRAGDAARALSLLDEDEKRFPSGALAEERQASRVMALCSAGRTVEAREVARAFLAVYPKSAAAIQVRASCGGG